MTRTTINVITADGAPIDWDAVGAAIAAAGKAATCNRLGEIEHVEITGDGIVGDIHASEWISDRVGRRVELFARADRWGTVVGTSDGRYVVRSDAGDATYVVTSSDFDLVD